MAKTFTVDEACTRLGVTSRTLHYYEEIGLLREVPRTEGGHRYYDESAVGHIEHILRLKNLLGISLHDIRAILDAEQDLERLKARYHENGSAADKERILGEVGQLLQSVIGTIDDKIGKLQTMRSSFAERLDRVKRASDEKELEARAGQ